jgi:superfamily II DNA or RNA helicase
VYSSQATDEFRNKENFVMYDHNNFYHFETLKLTAKELLNIAVDAVDVKKFFERIYQDGDVDLTIKKLKTHYRALLNAYTSYGKTMIATAVMIKILESQGGGLGIVTTPRTDTLGDFETNPFKFDFGTKSIPIVIRQSEIKSWPIAKIQKHIDQGYVVLLLLSVQGVRHKNNSESWSFSEINKYKKYFNLCDIWVRDEKWTEYGGAKTAKLMKELEGSMMILDLAATSSKIKDDYDSDAIIDRSLFWAMKNRKMTQLPQLMIEGIYYSGLKVIPEIADVYTDEENFNPRKLFVGNSTFTDFAHLSILETLPEYFYRENALAKKMGISIIDDQDLPAISKKVGLWILPEGSKDWPAEIYMPRLSQMWNRSADQKEFYVSAYELEQIAKDYETTNDCIKDLLNKYERIVILTHRKYTVGTSIDHIGHIVLFDNIGSDDLFEQLIGRILRLVLENGLNIKNLVKVKAIVPNLQLKSTLAKMVVEHSDKTESNAEAKEYFDLLGFRAYEVSGKSIKIQGEDVVDEIAKQRLAIAGSGLKPTEVQNYLSDDNIVKAWQNANLPKIKINSSGSLTITDDNNSKINKSKKSKAEKTQNNFSEEQIRKLMNEVYSVIKIASYCEESK